MCCFSIGPPVGWYQRLFPVRVHVSKTNIFARMTAPGVQAVAYGMNLKAARETAMVLPLPVVPGSGDDAVTFVDLHEHSTMFTDLAALFDRDLPAPRKGGASLAPRLVVHKVGSFIASYVPTRADFMRLDPRFRLPEVLFDAVPAYADHGFAVFQLEPGNVTVHPMAMNFLTREPQRLFFPTVHVHDGTFHPTAKFDHTLYYQLEGGPYEDLVSPMKPQQDYAGLVDPALPVVRRSLSERLPNADHWISVT